MSALRAARLIRRGATQARGVSVLLAVFMLCATLLAVGVPRAVDRTLTDALHDDLATAGNGRLALSVWNNVGIYNTAVSAALAQFVGSDTAARFNASRKTPAADELQQLVMEAGFSDVEVSVSRINVHLPQIDQFVLEHLAATPVASALEAVDAEARRKIGASAREQLQHYADGDGITYPEETHVLTARRK